ncbi:hypothetical protein DPEC_G00169350 [Dallia pectoralis]|uniref:Uncharacterized protein n=1 Tax=Dallia pectoralis TaxID=75939 RepID=A0ACC2GCH6_DALPE|nr:hypothetical protein DPEC_G00169350 [Dallia pectoralis]
MNDRSMQQLLNIPPEVLGLCASALLDTLKWTSFNIPGTLSHDFPDPWRSVTLASRYRIAMCLLCWSCNEISVTVNPEGNMNLTWNQPRLSPSGLHSGPDVMPHQHK